ncbi:amidase [Herbaspirillum frisingense]|uniref:amidase n=1 Tax=Herbaspirillum frisingense TaxID=92645 RepID=UPI001F44FA38|nr:amidase [Herbaspirillum frisingense]UIN22503.1 amidase [Herbaspirillum frisingense]
MQIPTIAQAAALIAARRLSPVELVQQCLDRITRLDGALHSFITVTPERALSDARAAEQRMMSGSLRGKLDGIPIAHKDVIATRGIRTTAHSRLLKDWVPDSDAEVVDLLDQAGTAMLGKLATHEFAWGGPPLDLPWPPARNPWDPARFSSGSSSGTAVAIAAGLVLGGTGTDTAGSIRAPSALCGITGIKPTYGLCSERGVLPLAPSLDHVGPMAWSVADCALLLQAMVNADTAAHPLPDYSVGLGKSIRGLRIGVASRWHEQEHEVTPAVQRGIQLALDIWRSQGAQVAPVELPSLHDYQAASVAIMASEAFTQHAPDLRTRFDEYGRLLRSRLALGALLPPDDLMLARRLRKHLRRQTLQAMAQVDVLVTAGAASEAPRMEEVPEWGDLKRPGFYHPFNLTGWPAISVCSGYGEGGLPVAVQIATRPHQESLLFQVAEAFERSAALRDHRPTIVASLTYGATQRHNFTDVYAKDGSLPIPGRLT